MVEWARFVSITPRSRLFLSQGHGLYLLLLGQGYSLVKVTVEWAKQLTRMSFDAAVQQLKAQAEKENNEIPLLLRQGHGRSDKAAVLDVPRFSSSETEGSGWEGKYEVCNHYSYVKVMVDRAKQLS